MLRAVDHLTTRAAAILPLRPGGRKTSITLAAFLKLRAQNRARVMLVVAPLRVCRQTWRQEAAKWEEFKDLKFSLLHGDKKEQRLEDDADIWLINPEGIPWLCNRFMGRSLPFDIVVIDELTKFKNSQSERFKALLPRLARVAFRWGLTGSPSPNGHMDLFGQLKILDDGAALGKYITHFRDQYFQLDWDGFTYNLMPGAEARITARLAPYWFDMLESDYAQLPPEVPDPRMLEMSGPARKIYDRMKRDMIAQLDGGVVTAANSAACYSKLSQMANGAVYIDDDKRVAEVIHDLKLEALEELADEVDGMPLLVAYEFNHDLERLKEWHVKRYGKPLPYLGKGTTATQEAAFIKDWNDGKLPIGAVHPASAGHGLNMQGCSAQDVVWFSISWDYELYDQLIRRIRRDGTQAQQIFNHMLLVKGTIDELKYAALGDKALTQNGLYHAMHKILSESETQGAGGQSQTQETTPMRLSRPAGAPAAPVEVQAPAQHQQPAAQQGNQAGGERVAPKGWGQKATGGDAPLAPVQDQQRQAIQERINPDANRAAFSGQVQDAAQAVRDSVIHPAPEPVQTAQPAAEPKATRTRTKAPEPDVAANAAVLEVLSSIAKAHFRAKAVELASQAHFAQNFESEKDLLDLADIIMDYISKA